jgi:murein DD-endopeptidase MepM/ murein hydrolase activator NlpD
MIRALPLLATSLLALTACNGSVLPPKLPPYYPPEGAPPPPANPVYYRLPFNGRWMVQRTHYGSAQKDQAYAIDMLPPTADNHYANGAGKENTDYPCYGQPILADAPGIVAIAVDGIPDNTPGTVNAYDQHGNYVVIDHQNGEFSLMAHMTPGSVRVHPSQWVETGTEIGRCGNSGLTTNPHVHWQVMNAVYATQAQGIAQRYAPFDKNGAVTQTMPDKGDFITPK